MNSPEPPSSEPRRLNLFFRLVVLAGAVFVVTILALVATVFGDERSPAVRFLNRHGGDVIFWEVTVFLVAAVLAITVDRWTQTANRRTKEK